MPNAIPVVPLPVNEPIRQHAPGSPERAELERELARQRGAPLDIPLVIGGREMRTGRTLKVTEPHAHARVIGTAHLGGAREVEAAIAAARAAAPAWAATSFEERASILL